MIYKIFHKAAACFGIWRVIHAFIIALCIMMLTVAIIRFWLPAPTLTENQDTLSPAHNSPVSHISDSAASNAKPAFPFRSGLFMPASGLEDKPIADKTIERIKSQLKLQCIMEMNGDPVAYINIQGLGLRKCNIGENINDMFTVININKQGKSVDISIIEHKVTLHL